MTVFPDVAAFRRDLEQLGGQLEYDVTAAENWGRFPAVAWKACADLGVLGLPAAVRHGGSQADPRWIAVVLEEVGAHCRDNGLLFAVGAQLWSCVVPLTLFGTAQQQAQYLPGLCAGDILAAQAMTEASSGSDALALTTEATADGAGFLLDGVKSYVTNAPDADLFTIYARTDPELGFAGISAFLVAAESPGLEVGPPVAKSGMRTAPMAEVRLRGCAVGPEDLLGPRGAGMAIFHRAMEWERSFILAPAVGTMRRQLAAGVEHARTVRRAGRALGQHQAVSHRLVDMRIRLETSRLFLYETARHKSAGRNDAVRAAMTKLHLSESFLAFAYDASALYGATGYLTGSETERTLRDALAARIYSGTSDIQRNVIAGGLGL